MAAWSLPQAQVRNLLVYETIIADCSRNMIQPVMKTPADRQKSIQLQWFVNRKTSVQLITALFNNYNVLKYAGKMSYTKEIPKFI